MAAFSATLSKAKSDRDLFRKACEFGLEGLVSKHRDRPYQGGRVEALDQSQEPATPCV
jgi:ATP-dependent DNA ligase